METNISALQKLYVKLGGSASDVANVTTIPEIIVKINSIVESAIAPELPEVTASDNGKVLMVVEGEWAVGTVG